MADQKNQTSDVHEIAMLLPWYVNGTLKEEQRHHVAEHLQHCSLCQREMQEITLLRQHIRQVYETEGAPSPAVLGSVMETIRSPKNAASRNGTTGEAIQTSWVRKLDQWLGALLSSPWIPTAATVILLIQLGTVTWLVRQQADREVPHRVVTRGLPGDTGQLVITFQQDATHSQMIMVLAAVKGTIVAGPASDGAYEPMQ
jgi:anti-sigma factor RsiW